MGKIQHRVITQTSSTPYGGFETGIYIEAENKTTDGKLIVSDQDLEQFANRLIHLVVTSQHPAGLISLYNNNRDINIDITKLY